MVNNSNKAKVNYSDSSQSTQKIDLWEPDDQYNSDKSQTIQLTKQPTEVEQKPQVTSNIKDSNEPLTNDYIEMRQVAGLAAGPRIKLPDGSFKKFREGNQDTGFAISYINSEITVVPENSSVYLDDRKIHKATIIKDEVLNVGSGRFILAPPRKDHLKTIERVGNGSKFLVKVPDFKKEQTSEWIYGESTQSPEINLDETSTKFLDEVIRARKADSFQQYLLHPDPEELNFRLSHTQEALFNRDTTNPFFSRFCIAYGSIPWVPKFDDPSKIPTKLHANINELCKLSSVPITANLNNGPLAIVGPRSATLAVARYAIAAICSLSSPGSIELKVVTTDKNHNSSWLWLSKLPNWISQDNNSYRVIVADSMRSFELTGLDHEKAKNNVYGLIIIEEKLENVPDYCSVVLQVSDTADCRATNRNNEQLNGTAVGIGEKFAGDISNKIAHIVPD